MRTTNSANIFVSGILYVGDVKGLKALIARIIGFVSIQKHALTLKIVLGYADHATTFGNTKRTTNTKIL